MPCLCQYFATQLGLRVEESLNVKDNLATEEGNVPTGDVNASELAACKMEIFALKRNLAQAQISSQNMEALMKAMIERQDSLIAELYELRRLNAELKAQQCTDRNSQALERAMLLKELHELKVLLRDRSNFVERTLRQNSELTTALRDANEKICKIGMKFLKLKTNRSSSRDGSTAAGSEGDISPDPTALISTLRPTIHIR